MCVIMMMLMIIMVVIKVCMIKRLLLIILNYGLMVFFACIVRSNVVTIYVAEQKSNGDDDGRSFHILEMILI